MNIDAGDCPGDLIESYLENALDQHSEPELLAHLDNCEHCRQRITDISAPPSEWTLLTEALVDCRGDDKHSLTDVPINGQFEPSSNEELVNDYGHSKSLQWSITKSLAEIMSPSDDLAAELERAGQASDERVWRLPLWPEYRKQMDSDIADIKNAGGRPAGTITAGWFLRDFVDDEVPWAHLDIAGTAWHSGKAKGSSGRPVPLLVDYLMSHAG